ncbi:hypothetical protein LWI29_026159 [Acer saccharum]|uniref:Uncharacterized protein n=1 Tax=Acer saccharum TaxID=4024 RepID=A0AA39VNU9_ACESA|nr:hypothetical protein LWI29_026159 [Acer saccharum]
MASIALNIPLCQSDTNMTRSGFWIPLRNFFKNQVQDFVHSEFANPNAKGKTLCALVDLRRTSAQANFGLSAGRQALPPAPVQRRQTGRSALVHTSARPAARHWAICAGERHWSTGAGGPAHSPNLHPTSNHARGTKSNKMHPKGLNAMMFSTQDAVI